MRRIISMTIPAALILGACVSVMAWRLGGNWAQPDVSQEGQAATAQPTAEPKVEFAPKGALDYLNERGFRGSRQIFESTDGVGIELTKEWRNSSEEADGALEERLREGGRVVERSPLLEKEGPRYGERVVAYFPAAEGVGERPAVLRTDGAAFFCLDSSSLRHLLLLEKQLFEDRPRAKERAKPTGLRPRSLR